MIDPCNTVRNQQMKQLGSIFHNFQILSQLRTRLKIPQQQQHHHTKPLYHSTIMRWRWSRHSLTSLCHSTISRCTLIALCTSQLLFHSPRQTTLHLRIMSRNKCKLVNSQMRFSSIIDENRLSFFFCLLLFLIWQFCLLNLASYKWFCSVRCLRWVDSK